MPGEEKTEKATSKKRQDERKKGNIFMSKDVTTVVSLIVSFFTMQFFVSSFISKLQEIYRLQNTRASELITVTPNDVMQIYRELILVFATTVFPVMLVIGAVAILITGMQTRFLFTREQMKFKLSRLSILKGIKKMVSLRSLVELAKSLIKVVLIAWLLFGKVKSAIDYLPMMIDWDIWQAASFTGKQIMSLVVSVTIAFGAVAVADYFYQWWEYEKGIKMTKQEVKDEYKNMEGNPEVKSKRRQKQREMSMNRMMQAVKDADVVVKNPTHFAVALKYKLNVDPAPVILAKGQDNIALRILAEAEEHHVATVENKTLARGLYELGNVNEAIPADFYQPVAELLAWLYSTREKKD